MNYSNKEYVEHLRRKYPRGTRLQLSCMEDEFPVPPGSMGTVECIDDAGQIHVDWDCGRSLANAKGVEGGIKLLDEENSSKFGISGDKGGTHLWWDNADKGNF